MIENFRFGAIGIPKTILIIDDDPIVLEISSEILTNAGYRVVCVENGEDAMGMAWDEYPDAILLDCSLPGKPGMQVLDEFRSSARFDTIPIAMMTARKGDLSEKVSRLHGANDYIRKPFEPAELVIQVTKMIR